MDILDDEEIFSPFDFKEELNEEQYRAVTASDGPSLVLAGAGSGKTRTLTYRVAYLLQRGVRPGEILLLTFTNKAAREMLSRVNELTGIPPTSFWGGTFHSIGMRTLRMFGEPVGFTKSFTVLDQADAEALLAECVRDVDKSFLKNKNHPKAKVILSMISYARNTRTPLGEVIEREYPFFDSAVGRIESFFKAYQERKLKQQVADYDDLLVYWLRLLEQEKDMRNYFNERFRHVLVDEYQDTNVLQARIVDLVASEHRLMAVGDDAQCIYTWRGADFENIMTFPDRHPETQVHKIETNYRSTPQILDLANDVIRHQPRGTGFEKDLRAVRDGRERPFVVSIMDSRQEAQFIINRVEGLIDEGRSLSDIAVLYRAHFQALDLQVELSRRGIPFQITSGVRFFEQAHVKDLVCQLRLAANPRDESAFLRVAMLLPKIGSRTAFKLHGQVLAHCEEKKVSVGKAMLSDELKNKPPKDARAEWESLAHTLAEVAEAVETATPQRAVELALEGWYAEYIRNVYPNWRNRVEDLEGLVGFSARFEDMSDMLAQLVLISSETSDRSISPDDEAIKLTTVHQAKGLEFPVVFIISLGDGMFPLNRAIEEDNLEEERRLFYVAVTRAMDELYLSYTLLNTRGGGGAMQLRPSRFLLELDKSKYELVKWRPSTSQW